jgi:phage terminase Nu1 subunit (DNA packaging protein)
MSPVAMPRNSYLSVEWISGVSELRINAGPSPAGRGAGAWNRENASCTIKMESRPMLDDRLVTLDDLAGIVGINRRNLQTLVERGVLTRVTRGKYPLAKSIRAYCENLREQAASRDHVRVGSGLAAERERIAREQADSLEMKNAAARGEMIPAKEVEAQWSDILRMVRSGMLALPSRVQQRLGHLSAHDLSVLDREIRDTLEEISEDPI